MENIYQRKSFYPFIFTMLFLNALGIAVCYFYGNTAIVDEMEHLRVSWLITQGYLPYRDFFEHHHPLLWFAWSPLMKILPQHFEVDLYIARLAALLFSAGSLTVFFFWVKRFFGGIKTACLAVCFYFIIYVSWYTFSIFKPDTFARFFYLLGLYQFFAFCQNKKTKDLVWCGVSFTISFLFLQTLIFSIFPLIFPAIWLLYKKQISCKALGAALVAPLLILSATLMFLYFTDSLAAYFQLNWVFNSYLFKAAPFSNDLTIYNNPTINSYGIYIVLAIAASAFLLIKHKTDFNTNIVIILLVGEIFHLLCFSAALPHYFVYFFIFSAVIFALICRDITDSVLINTIKLCLIAGIFINAFMLCLYNNKNTLRIMRLLESSENKTVLNCGDVFYVWEPLHHYYWFYPYMEAIDSILYNRYPEFDINEYLQAHEIEYISMNKRVKCDAALEKDALPPDNYHNLQNFIVKPEIYDKYEEVYEGFYKRKAD